MPMRMLSLSQVGSKQAGEDSTLKIAQLVIKKFKFFKWYGIFRLSGATGQESALNADTMANIDHQFELAFSKPEDLDWLENDMRENGHEWKARHVELIANHLQAHGRQVPECKGYY